MPSSLVHSISSCRFSHMLFLIAIYLYILNYTSNTFAVPACLVTLSLSQRCLKSILCPRGLLRSLHLSQRHKNSTDSITPSGVGIPDLWYSKSLNSPMTSNILNTYILAVLYFWSVVSSQDQHLAWCSHSHLVPQMWFLLNSPGTYTFITS